MLYRGYAENGERPEYMGYAKYGARRIRGTPSTSYAEYRLRRVLGTPSTAGTSTTVRGTPRAEYGLRRVLGTPSTGYTEYRVHRVRGMPSMGTGPPSNLSPVFNTPTQKNEVDAAVRVARGPELQAARRG